MRRGHQRLAGHRRHIQRPGVLPVHQVAGPAQMSKIIRRHLLSIPRHNDAAPLVAAPRSARPNRFACVTHRGLASCPPSPCGRGGRSEKGGRADECHHDRAPALPRALTTSRPGRGRAPPPKECGLTTQDTDLTIRPITGPGELELFTTLPYRLNEELADDLKLGRRQPEWLWMALRDGHLVARAAWWARPGAERPHLLDILDV